MQGHTNFYSLNQPSDVGMLGRVKYWWDHSNLVVRLRVVDYVMSLVQYVRGADNGVKFKHVG